MQTKQKKKHHNKKKKQIPQNRMLKIPTTTEKTEKNTN